MKKTIAFFFLLFVSLQSFSQGLKIVTGHPDFKVRVTRCEAAGNTVIMNFLLENVGNKEERVVVYGGALNSSFAIDDEGNIYNERAFQVQMNEPMSSVTTGGTLYPDTPVKLIARIEGVPESAAMFRKIILEVKCDDWGLGDKKKVQISDVPIYHEGD